MRGQARPRAKGGNIKALFRSAADGDHHAAAGISLRFLLRKETSMLRLTLLLLALSVAVVAPAAHAAPVVPGGPTPGYPTPGDRDGDFFPDSTDKCPDTWGGSGYQGCPPSADRDGDMVLDMDDACPDVPGQQANGCAPFAWRFFFVNLGIKDLLSDRKSNTTYCSGLPECKTTHVTLTLSAETAKAAGITKRRISSISVPVPTMGFHHDISSADTKKLARLKKITLTIDASVTLASGQRIEAAPKTRTLYTKLGVATQLSSDGAD